MKTGIFGGTFNPPHFGHIRLCENMAKALGLDKIIVIPACIPPHKASLSLAKDEIRLEMCRAAFKDPLFEVSDIEIKRGGKSYTVETLRELKKQRPADELFFITGSDMFSSFHTWYRPEEILSLAFLAVASRENDFTPDFSPYTEEEKERIKFVSLPVTVLSSTEVRQKIRYKENLTGLLPQGVIDLIEKNALYDDGLYEYRKLLLTKLDKKRIFHSECVSESACQLALQYGADKDRAAKAGLLHDIMKNALDEEHMKYIPEMTALEKVSRPVWHQMSAPGFLRENGIVTDEEILKAISTHTTGSAGMTKLQKVVYVADFISADRDYPDVGTVRSLSRTSLEKAILYTAKYTIDKMLSLCKPVHPLTVDCYNEMTLLLNDERK